MAKHPGGRPTEYSPEIIEKIKEYLELCVDENEQIVKQENTEKGYQMYETRLKVRIPTIEGLAVHLKIHKDTIYEWVSIYPEFSDAIEELRAIQSDRVLNNGLAGTYNSTIAKLLLSSKHGYVEKTATDLTSKGDKITVPDSEAVKLAKEYEEKLKKGF